MPQREINTAYYRVDSSTGYLESKKEQLKFNARNKWLFIKILKERGDIEEACRLVGISRRILAPHLRADSKFRKDFLEVKQELNDSEGQRKREVLERLWKQANS